MHPPRRQVLRSAAAAATLAIPMWTATSAQKTTFNFKYANNVPLTHPLNVRAKEMADGIRADTDGGVDIEIFPNSQLGSDTDVLGQLRLGGVEFLSLSGLILSTLIPSTSISGIGFAFNDYASVWRAMDGELGGFVRGEIAKAGLVAMEKIWDNGCQGLRSLCLGRACRCRSRPRRRRLRA
jgi:TRAP-type C4-dicarboxylate transport system substrate-binding protein